MPTILLIESDADTREAMVELLDSERYDVVARPAIDPHFETAIPASIDLVLCDCVPWMQLRPKELLPQLVSWAYPIPVGLMSTSPLERSLVEASGVAFSLRKPFGMEQLLAHIAAQFSPVVPPGTDAEADLVYRYFEALTCKDWHALGALCTEDVEYHLPASNQFGQQVRGRDAFLDFSRQTFQAFSDARFADVKANRLPTGWTGRYAGSWTGPDGQRHSLPGAVVFHMRDGLIARIGVRLNAERLAVIAPAAAAVEQNDAR